MSLEKNEKKENEEVKDSTVILEDDKTGEVFKCDVLDNIEFEGKAFVVLLPEEEDDTVVILEVKKDDEGEYYIGVQDDEVLEKVFGLFEERNPEYFTDSEDE